MLASLFSFRGAFANEAARWPFVPLSVDSFDTAVFRQNFPEILT
jgi:hypothetical protein